MCLIVLCFLSLCYMCIYLFDCYSMYMLFANKEFIHSFILLIQLLTIYTGEGNKTDHQPMIYDRQ